ncbi:type II secretion system F family protein [Tropicimonas marinistellae]|uniref:type II secretion system F family protein n=1 Tax=Tropicimonas marinistellae TaxID=1739787 RepID=UPI00082A5B68|nr:type II secretion system F family protein [Tropicimonas marinistellae]
MELLISANDWLVDRFGELGPLYAVGVLGVLLVALTLPVFLKRQADPLDKLKNQGSRQGARGGKDGKAALRYDNGKAAKLDKYASFLEPQDEKEMSSARLKMLQAGYRSKSAVRTYHFAQFALGVGFLILGILYAIVSSTTGEVTTQALILSIIIPGAVGYYIPKYWVNRRLQTRQQEITNGFPDSLDMMLVCVEAGQSLEQSIIRVSKELRAGFPALADEYEMVAHEMKAGKDKVQVLKDMAERAGVPDVASFVTVLIQSASFGTSIAEALRVYASEMRDKRVMRAEEKANVLPTKLTLGTMMFTVPPLLIILIGPSIYEIAQTLSGNGGGF